MWVVRTIKAIGRNIKTFTCMYVRSVSMVEYHCSVDGSDGDNDADNSVGD